VLLKREGEKIALGVNMDSAQDVSSKENESLSGKVMNSLGEPESAEDEIDQSTHSSGSANSNLDIDHAKALSSAKKRLKAQSMNHEREVRELHARIADLQSKMPQSSQDQAQSPYQEPFKQGSVEEQIHKAVSYALNHRDLEERKAQEAKQQAEIQKEYRDLYKHLESLGDKYDDFHDIVFGEDTQYTPTMRDYAMTLPKKGKASAGEVLYKLGKNPEELIRIAKLPPHRQAQEMMLLRDALMNGAEEKGNQPRVLGQIKTNPVSHSHASVTEKTPIGNLRQRMKSGNWK
jgi:hypothetical protein